MKPKTFHDLKVWQLAHKLSLDVTRLTNGFPAKEAFRLTDQMVRSVRPAPANIAEGFGRYHYNDKLTFYERALSSLGELDNHLAEALGNKYITETINTKFLSKLNEVSFLLNKMMKNIRKARDNDNSSRKIGSNRRLNSKPKAYAHPGGINSKPQA
ncbi:MAG: four helix bundle protein [Planctomycetes bacterium]|nr:four helix bundle protein [Planctomycetota bacterium]